MKTRLVVLALVLASCHKVPYLPHRPITELSSFGQGHNPGRGECHAGQMPYYLELDDGTSIFLECVRSTP